MRIYLLYFVGFTVSVSLTVSRSSYIICALALLLLQFAAIKPTTTTTVHQQQQQQQPRLSQIAQLSWAQEL